MDVGIFGGTFDPVHQGHLKSALAVKEALELDQIVIMPNRMPYYKDRVGTSDAKDSLDKKNKFIVAVSERDCTACGLCANICPVKCLSWGEIDDKNGTFQNVKNV